MLLNRDDILKADDRPIETVPVPEWGGEVLVRGMSGEGRNEYEASLAIMRGGQLVPEVSNTLAKLVARCIVGEDGEPVFSQSDVHALGQKSAAALERVGNAAARLSGISIGELEVEVDLEKGSALVQDASSTSGSRSSSDAPSGNSSRRRPAAS